MSINSTSRKLGALLGRERTTPSQMTPRKRKHVANLIARIWRITNKQGTSPERNRFTTLDAKRRLQKRG